MAAAVEIYSESVSMEAHAKQNENKHDLISANVGQICGREHICVNVLSSECIHAEIGHILVCSCIT